jgi:hypothetical protein
MGWGPSCCSSPGAGKSTCSVPRGQLPSFGWSFPEPQSIPDNGGPKFCRHCAKRGPGLKLRASSFPRRAQMAGTASSGSRASRTSTSGIAVSNSRIGFAHRACEGLIRHWRVAGCRPVIPGDCQILLLFGATQLIHRRGSTISTLLFWRIATVITDSYRGPT